MSVEIPADIQGLDGANAELDKLMAADAAAAGAAGNDNPESATTDGQRAAGAEQIENVQDQQTEQGKKTDTPAASESDAGKKAAEAAQADKGKDPQSAEPTKSRYEKARERQERTWQELNAQKEAFKNEQDALKREREQFERERQEHTAKREEAEKQFTPEQYDQAAKKFEAEGKFDLAELAKAKADELRKNPPAQREAQAARATEAARKEWTLKAGVDFPEIAKQNSPLQVRVAQLFQENPEMKAHPKGIYLAARLASLEAEAAGVPTLKAEKLNLQKELDQARAKVKELEGLTAPGGPGSAHSLPTQKSFEQKSESEQFAELAQQAQELGTMLR